MPVQAAVWRTDTFVDLRDSDNGNWGFRTGECHEGAVSAFAVRGLTVDTLMHEHGLDYIDILKVDTEGSEKDVVESCAPWIDRGGILIVQLHDRRKRGVQSKCQMATPLLIPSLSTGRPATRHFSAVLSKAGHRLVACGRQ